MDSVISDKLLILSSMDMITLLQFDKNHKLKHKESFSFSQSDKLSEKCQVAVSKKSLIFDTFFFTHIPSLIDYKTGKELASLCIDTENDIELVKIESDSEFHTIVKDDIGVIEFLKQKISNIEIHTTPDLFLKECQFAKNLKQYMGVWIRESWMQICVFKGPQLLLNNTYPMANLSDIIYFILLQIEAFDLNFSELEIEIYGKEAVTTYEEALMNYFENIKFRTNDSYSLGDNIPNWMIWAVL